MPEWVQWVIGGVASLLGLGAGAKGIKHLTDSQQNERISKLEQKLDQTVPENRIIKLEERMDGMESNIVDLRMDIRLNFERDKANQDKIIAILDTMKSDISMIKNFQSEEAKIEADFYYLNPELKKPSK